MDPQILSKITRVHSNFVPRMSKGVRLESGPYWWGFWQENGKTLRVYIGRKLPGQLKSLLSTRVKYPGHSQYSWPGRPQQGA